MGGLEAKNGPILARIVPLGWIDMCKKNVLMILVDGLRHDYINADDSPFLQSLAKLNIDGMVRETFAFELRPAFFAGLHPEECDVANMFHYNPEESLFRYIDLHNGARSRISRELRKEAARRGYSLVEHIGGPAEIPLNVLKYFDFSEKYHTTEKSSIGEHMTLFDYLRSDGKSWLWIAYPDGPGTTSGVLDQFNERFDPDTDFIYLHFSELDWVGHSYGPHSEEQKKTFIRIDEAIRQVYVRVNQSFSEVRGVIFGDHGQVEIRAYLDIESMLQETGLKVEKDYIYFLDSTQARFWFFNDRAKTTIEELLGSIPSGKILTKDDYARLRFRFKHNKFGDLIFVVNDGVGIFPNYFQNKVPYKGLHGYMPEVEGNWAKLIITGCASDKHIDYPVEMVDLFPTLLELLGYESPIVIEPRSVFERESIDIKQENLEISLVIPTNNRLNILKKCLSAIENQTVYKDCFELVVVNDGSTDGTEEFLEEYENRTDLNFQYINHENSGPALARNMGLKSAQGKIIILLGDDMIVPTDYVANHLKFHKQWPQYSHACLGFIDWPKGIGVTPLMEYITTDGGQQFCWDEISKMDSDDIGWKFFWSSNISFKRKYCLAHALFDYEVFRHAMWEDIELGFRLDKAGLVLHFRKGFVVYHEHKINLESFAERQRMVGWYIHDLYSMGVDIGFTRNPEENAMLYSRDAIKYIVNTTDEFEKNCADCDKSILKKIYNYVLYYSTLVGYEERKNNLEEVLRSDAILLYNMSRTHELYKFNSLRLAETEVQLAEKDQQITSMDSYIKALKKSLSWRITAPLRKLFALILRIDN